MKKFKSVMLKIGTMFTILLASIVTYVCVPSKNVYRGGALITA